MRLHSIRIEGRGDIAWPPRSLFHTLIHSLGTQAGPTFVVLTGPNDQYVQAAGSAGRYILESRDTYGEGLQHLRAGRPGLPSGSKTTVYYRWKCTQGIHPSLGCPLEVDDCCVLSLDEVTAALLHYARTGERAAAFDWHDVTEEHREKKDSQTITTRSATSRLEGRCHDGADLGVSGEGSPGVRMAGDSMRTGSGHLHSSAAPLHPEIAAIATPETPAAITTQTPASALITGRLNREAASSRPFSRATLSTVARTALSARPALKNSPTPRAAATIGETIASPGGRREAGIGGRLESPGPQSC